MIEEARVVIKNIIRHALLFLFIVLPSLDTLIS